MSEHIEAKPTEYRGVQFKSRLEARWAVFFDYYFLVNEWEYEPVTLKIVEKGWEYTPDFRVVYGGFPLLFEVKPIAVTAEHHFLLESFGARLQGSPLHLLTGSFYDNDIKVQNITLRDAPVKLVAAFPQSEDAAETANRYRFDIPYVPPPFRKGSVEQFRDIIRQQQSIQRREARKPRKK